VVRHAHDVSASIVDPTRKRLCGSVKNAPPSLCELRRFDAETTNGELDTMPVPVRHLTNDLGVALFSNPPAFGRCSLHVEEPYMGTVGDASRKHSLR
jgi:hypothetical protein